MTARWAVVKPTLSPKLGAGDVDLYWEGPDGRLGSWDAFGPVEDAATFPSEAATLESLVATFGVEWERHRSLQGARVVEIGSTG